MEAQLADPFLTTPFRVSRNRKDTADTRTLDLSLSNGQAMPAWQPGQFMMLYVFGAGEIAISISGDPSRRDTITHTVRAVGDVSRAICEAKPGTTIGVRGPFGNAWPLAHYEDHDIVIVAGGIGLAPLRPVLYAILANRKRYRRVSLLVGARTPDILLYSGELARWRKRDIDVHLTVDAAAPGWQWSVGPVTTLIPRAAFEPDRAGAFLVGPEIMMRVVVQVLAERRLPLNRIFISMERNMKCAVGFCGHCQFGPTFICKDGPVFPYSHLQPWLAIRNL
jgi:NAD(P)H-flavin reductase